MPKKSRRFFNALYVSALQAGMDCEKLTHYVPCKVLVVYGPGGPDRYPFIQQHLAGGGNAVLFDLGYWARNGENRKYRLSINGLHPTRDQLYQGANPGPGRYNQTGQPIQSRQKPREPYQVLLVGNAPKAQAVGAKGWTRSMAKAIRQYFPDWVIHWRPKPRRPRELDIPHDHVSHETIDRALKRVGLVVCKHSNVAIDACIAGVSVVCEAGAAAAIYPRDLTARFLQPTQDERVEFLHRLAWWQWGINETGECWQWIFGTFPALDHRRISGSGYGEGDQSGMAPERGLAL